MFRQLTETVLVSPQISVEDVALAKSMGVSFILNNRPEGESPDQTPGDEVARAAEAAGIGYAAVPVNHSGFAPWQLDGMDEALGQLSTGGKLLAYCRSGTRSTLLWALSRARAGEDPDQLADVASAAGYDLSPVRQIMDTLAAAPK
ncbi:TIGR01244 family sulfur transferase [Sphingobium sp. DEHP117]|uniref:TIGR01244 family sulfur transferase n=1 Tax=Sphingobium sp. DEHP117 TaxID=2993436 RepID=UPI0027D5A272|nr:TIGR01244 family sulfur transferase [Sphingobium sp. DEHP117]MDQ4421216.1 TIGR01244 family sulfur transferase [Sphingobium sp. DEHP117]